MNEQPLLEADPQHLLAHRLAAVRQGVSFAETLALCVKTPELVKEFDRLCGTNLALRGTPLELAVDDASGRLEADLGRFVEFCWDCVFMRFGAPMLFRDGSVHG